MEKTLGNLVKIKTGKLNANASDENGSYPFFTCAKKISRINKFAFDSESVLVAGNGELNVKYYEGKFNAYQRTYVIDIIDKKLLSTKYVYYFLDKYIQKKWDEHYWNFIVRHKDIVKWFWISRNPNITMDIIEKNPGVLFLDRPNKRDLSIRCCVIITMK